MTEPEHPGRLTEPEHPGRLAEPGPADRLTGPGNAGRLTGPGHPGRTPGAWVPAATHRPVDAPSGWAELTDRILACRTCPDLVVQRISVVVGDVPAPGHIEARPLALVGEAPGAAEDAQGRPFVGRAGQLLDRLLVEAGLDRSGVAVLNTVKCRPPGNRAPRSVEVANCAPYLRAQLAVLRPRLVVALGLTAVRWFLGAGVSLGAARGAVHEVEVAGLPLRVIATYHPSAAIRFGPGGAPLAALRADLAVAAKEMA
jgi:uracil-DNA glycosylase family 4